MEILRLESDALQTSNQLVMECCQIAWIEQCECSGLAVASFLGGKVYRRKNLKCHSIVPAKCIFKVINLRVEVKSIGLEPHNLKWFGSASRCYYYFFPFRVILTQLDAKAWWLVSQCVAGRSSEAISTARLPVAIELINSVAFCPHSGLGADGFFEVPDGAGFHFLFGSVVAARKDLWTKFDEEITVWFVWINFPFSKLTQFTYNRSSAISHFFFTCHLGNSM